MTVISISMAYVIVFISRMSLEDSKTILFCSVRIVKDFCRNLTSCILVLLLVVQGYDYLISSGVMTTYTNCSKIYCNFTRILLLKNLKMCFCFVLGKLWDLELHFFS